MYDILLIRYVSVSELIGSAHLVHLVEMVRFGSFSFDLWR